MALRCKFAKTMMQWMETFDSPLFILNNADYFPCNLSEARMVRALLTPIFDGDYFVSRPLLRIVSAVWPTTD